MAINPFITNIFIDSCAFDPKYEPEDKASLEIFRLSQEGKLSILIAHSTQKEIEHPNTPKWVKLEAQNRIFTIEVPLKVDEGIKLREIEIILAGNGKIENIRQDASHIFEAQKYGSKYFITTDSRILNRKDKLYKACTVIVLKPSKFLSLMKDYINVENGNKVEPYASGNVSAKPKSQGDIIVNRISYNGYIIQAAPYQFEWKINIFIENHTGDAKQFYAANSFKTKEESIQHCIILVGRLLMEKLVIVMSAIYNGDRLKKCHFLKYRKGRGETVGSHKSKKAGIRIQKSLTIPFPLSGACSRFSLSYFLFSKRK